MTDFSHPKASVTDSRRWTTRHDCKIRARIFTDGHETDCVVVNIAAGGIGITFDSILRVKVNSKVMVSCPELGTVGCIVRWVAQINAGLEFDTNAKMARKPKDLLSVYSGEDGF